MKWLSRTSALHSSPVVRVLPARAGTALESEIMTTRHSMAVVNTRIRVSGKWGTRQPRKFAKPLACILMFVVAMGMALPAFAQRREPKGAAELHRAGSITALLPTAHVVRGVGRKLSTTVAKKGEELYWNDLVKTDRGGRARITLEDQSILSLGSQAELRIVKQDVHTQQTALQLAYGRLRAEVTTVTRQGGSFQLRTPTAVAGVIGTVFGTDSSIGQTQFLCISGVVSVGSSDPGIPQTSSCEPGMAVTVQQGKAPTARPATTEEIQQFIQDTEPAIISGLSPASAIVNTTLDVIATGSHMGGITGVTVSGAGVTASLNTTGATATSVGVHLQIAADAAPGPRVITFTKPNGQNSAAVFTVLASPTAATGGGPLDPVAVKKPYYAIFDQEYQSAIASLNGIGLSIKQSADSGGAQLNAANQGLVSPVSLTEAANQLQAQVTDINNYVIGAAARENTAYTAAKQALDTGVAAAIQDLQKRTGATVADDTFNQAVTAAFNAANQVLMQAFSGIYTDVGAHAQLNNTAINGIVQNWLQQIAAASPAFTGKDQTVEQGGVGSFNSGSLGSSATSIQWMLCDPSYKPSKIGVQIPASTPGCTPISGYTSNSSEFAVNTCTLSPGDYAVRLVLNGTSAYETYLHVLRPAYDDPQTRLQNLGVAYGTLKPESFLAFFDSQQYTGYPVLSENIRATMQTLSAMSVKIIITTSSISCNVANLQATWQSNYTFKGSTQLLQQPAENVFVRMNRVVGQGWYITDFQGENGTVQGAPPGPQSNVDVALPDLQLTNVRASADGTTGIPIGGAVPSNFYVLADVANVGNLAVTQAVDTQFNVTVGSFTVTGTVALPNPFDVNATTTLKFPVNVSPVPAPGTPVNISVTANPTNTLQEKRSDNNNGTASYVSGGADLKVSAISTTAPLIATKIANGTVTLQNTGSANFSGSSQNLVITGADFSGLQLKLDIPAIAVGQSVAVPFAITLPNLPGTHPLTASINPRISTDTTPQDDTLTTSITISPAWDLGVKSITFGTLVATGPGTATVTVQNLGPVDFPGAPNNLVLTSADFSTFQARANIPVVPAGGSVDVPVTFTVPAALGSHPFTATISPAVTGDTNSANDSLTANATLQPAYDLAVAKAVFGNLVTNQAGTVTVTVQNLGPMAFPGSTNNLVLTSSDFATLKVSVNIPAIPVSGSVDVPVAFTVPATPGSHPFTVTINPTAPLEANTSNDTLVTSATLVAASVDLKLTSLALGASSTPPFLSGQSQSVTFQVQNNGNVASAAGTWSCSLNVFPNLPTGNRPSPSGVVAAPTSTIQLATGSFPVIAAGASGSTITASFTVPRNAYGNDTVSCAASQDPLESSANLTDNTASVGFLVNANINLAFATPPTPPGSIQLGSTGNVQFQIQNTGLDDAPAGWTLALVIGTFINQSVTGPAVPAGSTVSLDMSGTFGSAGTTPVDVTVPGSVTINANRFVQETNYTDDVFSANIRFVDFVVAPVPTGTLVGVAGRPFQVGNLLSLLPSTYPSGNLTVNYTGLPAGLVGAPAFPGQVSGTPAGASASTSVALSATADNVTHTAGSVNLTINPELSAAVSGTAPVLFSGGPAGTLTLHVTGGAGTVTVTPTFPTGITTASTLAQSPDASGNVSWSLQAGFNVVSTGTINIPVQLTDTGVPATGTPAGSVPVQIPLTVNGQANFVITNVAVTGHAAPYTGANALQTGENISLAVTVQNVGNATISGNLQLQFGCSSCGTPISTGPYAAPAAGQSSTFTMTLGNVPLAAASGYTGSVSLTTTIPQSSTSDDSFNFGFDVADFNVSLPSTNFTIQNVPVGGSADVPVTVSESGTSPAFNIAMTAAVGTGGVTVTPPNPFLGNQTQNVHIVVPSSGPTNTNDTLTITGSNRGVTKPSVTQQLHYYTASIAPSTLLANSQSQPLLIPVYDTSTPSPKPEKVELTLSGDFDTSAGSASISIQPPAAGINATLIGGTGLTPGNMFEVDLWGNVGASTQPTKVTIVATIPGTNPSATVSYDLWVSPTLVEDLAVTSVTVDNGGISLTSPWLVGEGVPVSVGIQNLGSVASAGTEQVSITFNGVPISSTTVPVINPGASTTVNFPSVVLPDGSTVPSMSTVNAIISGGIDPNSQNNQLATPLSLATSDWRLFVTGAVGQSDASPLTLPTATGGTSNSTQIGVVIDNYPSVILPPGISIGLANGVQSTGFTSTISPTTISASNNVSAVTITEPTTPPAAGSYFFQFVGSMVVGGQPTAKRQATVHISLTSGAPQISVGMTGTFAGSSTPSFVGTSANPPTGSVQLNGPLPEAITLTPTCTSCTGTTDLSFTEAPYVEVFNSSATSQVQQQTGVSFGTPVNLSLVPVQGPDGTVMPAPATITVSSTNNPAILAGNAPAGNIRQPSPDATGQQFLVAANVGDLYLNAGSACLTVAPGKSASISVSFLPVNGFNASSISLQWFTGSGASIPGNILTVTSPASETFAAGYPSANVTFTNTSTGVNFGYGITLGVTFSSRTLPGQSITKYFPMELDLSSTGQFCGGSVSGNAMAGSRGGSTVIHGVYGKVNLVGTPSAAIAAPVVSAGLPDVQVSASDITFYPSIPKPGDTVDVRFRLRNAGSVKATGVPVALQLDGRTVAQDTFDVPADGSALGGLHWLATLPSRPAARPVSRPVGTHTRSHMARTEEDIPTPGSEFAPRPMQLAIVIDPSHLTRQKTTIAKSAPVAHFMMRPAETPASPFGAASGREDRLVLELVDGSCVSFRFSSGPGDDCGGNTDFEVSVDDLANGRYSISAYNGIADVGFGQSGNLQGLQFSSRAAAVPGHTYAVKLNDGRIGQFTVFGIISPQQLQLKAMRVFQASNIRKAVSSLGGSSGVPSTGELTGGVSMNQPHVYLNVGYQAPQ